MRHGVPTKRRFLRRRSAIQLKNISANKTGLEPSNIKVLSLFFIDRVDNYAQEDGMIRRLFNKCFNELKSKIP